MDQQEKITDRITSIDNLPEDLIQKIRNREVILWVGSGLSSVAGYPSSRELGELIKKHVKTEQVQYLENKELDGITEEFIQLYPPRTNLENIIVEVFNKEPKNIEYHKLIRDIPEIEIIITTNYDKLFENVYGDKLISLVDDSDIIKWKNNDFTHLFKIHGCIDSPNKMIITKTDYTNFLTKKHNSLIWNFLKGLVSTHTILFIGYSFEDQNIKYIFEDILERLNNKGKDCYLISPNIPEHKLPVLSKYKIHAIQMKAEDAISEIFKVINNTKKTDPNEQAELFLDLMSHDINNINTVAIGYLELALYRVHLDDEGQMLLHKSLEAMQNSLQLIYNVKKIRAIYSGLNRETIDLGSMLDFVIREYQNTGNKNVIIDYAPVTGYFVLANQLLRDVFLNLIGMAIRYSPGPIKIWIRAEPVIGVKCYRVIIEDDGPGITDDIKRTFNERTGKMIRLVNHRNLGLYVVKKLVESYNGMILVENRIQGDTRSGTRFIVTLPAADDPQNLQTVPSLQVTRGTGNSSIKRV